MTTAPPTAGPPPDPEEVFADALELPTGQRAEFVRRACRDDAALIGDVEELLLAHDRAAGTADFLAPPPTEQRLAELAAAPVDPLVGARVGEYQVLRRLGRGGFGNVYLAMRTEGFQQKVAIKALRSDIAIDDRVRARFELERQLLADLQHDHIARLLSGGTLDDGRPYIVMEYVKGQPITEYCDGQRLGVAERLELFRQVCRAVAYAHSYSVIHRDIKPANVMVNEGGQVKLLDFGIAKLVDPVSVRRMETISQGGAPLTPQYASPEQVRGEAVSTASDVYSLGVVLYELLTGRPPYDLNNLTWTELVRVICDQEPRRPSAVVLTPARNRRDGDTLSMRSAETLAKPLSADPQRLHRQLKGDLEQIVLMALRKEPKARYQTVEALVADLDHYRRGETVVARPVTSVERLRRWVRRRPAAAALVGAVAVAAIVTTAWGLREALLGRELRLQLSDNLVRGAELHGRRGEWSESLELLAEAERLGSRDPVGLRVERIRALESLNRGAEAEAELALLAERSDLGPHEAEVRLLQGMYVLPKEGIDAAQTYLLQARGDDDLAESDRALIDGLLAETSKASIEAFERAVAADPYSHEARRFLTFVLTVTGRFEEAVLQAETSELLFPDDPGFPILLAYLSALRGDVAGIGTYLGARAVAQLDPDIVAEYGKALQAITKFQNDIVDFWDFARVSRAKREVIQAPLIQDYLFGNSFEDDVLGPGWKHDSEGLLDVINSIGLVMQRVTPNGAASALEDPSQLIGTGGPRCFALAYEPLIHLYSARTLGFLREGKGNVDRIDDLIGQLLTASHAHPESFLSYARGQLLYVRGRYDEAAIAFGEAARQRSVMGPYPPAAAYAAAICEYDRHRDGVDGALELALAYLRLRLKSLPIKPGQAESLYEIAVEGRDFDAARSILDVLAASGMPPEQVLLRRAHVELSDGHVLEAFELASQVPAESPLHADAVELQRKCAEKLRAVLTADGAPPQD